MTTYDNQEELKRQWMEALGPGWPYEVFYDFSNSKNSTLVYFEKTYKGNFYFYSIFEKGKDYERTHTGSGGSFKNYFPLSTPLDFVPDWATHIEIETDGEWRFWQDSIQKDNDGWFPWPNCPKGMKGKIFEIPDDWRPK